MERESVKEEEDTSINRTVVAAVYLNVLLCLVEFLLLFCHSDLLLRAGRPLNATASLTHTRGSSGARPVGHSPGAMCMQRQCAVARSQALPRLGPCNNLKHNAQCKVKGQRSNNKTTLYVLIYRTYPTLLALPA